MFAADSNSKIKSMIKELKNKKPDKIDSPEVRQAKGLYKEERSNCSD